MNARTRRAPAAPRASALVLLALAVLLVLPAATAHVTGARPVLQRSERDRVVGLDPEALGLGVDLSLTGDPLRQLVTHYMDPTRGLLYVEHREDGSRGDERFYAQWKLERLVEFRDANVNNLYEPQSDLRVRSWALDHYRWQRQPLRSAEVDGVQGTDILWEANLTGAPHVRAEAFIAGKSLADEGALVRPQDVITYLDFTQMPARQIGSLYALEATVTVQESTQLSLYDVDNVSTALLADAPGRRALFVWGGEAQLDDTEQRLVATITNERVDDRGNRTATFTLHIPTVDRSMRFVFVTGVEYEPENLRTPFPGALVLVALSLMALLRRR